ncbi:MAG: response regulator [Anaerolineales bacterium]|nr:response regulator [Anaerolineales bacterium]
MSIPNLDSPVKILVVDDHPNTATMLARAIAQLGRNVEVASATSGREALDRAKERAPDILLTDMIMPEMTGLELIEKLKNSPSGAPAFCYLITAYDVPGLTVSARRLKVKDVIVKPVRPERISQIISDAMAELDQVKPAKRDPSGKKPFRILVADDQPDNLMLLARYLKSEGYEHIQAKDGVDALEKVRHESPDLVLLDVNMPHKDGFEVLREIRADPATEHIPVIILTAARLDASEVQMGLNLGADDYVTKPFDRRELFARIRTKLRVKEAEDLIRRRNRELNLLPEIGKDLSARLNLDELSDLVLRRTVETLGAEAGHIILLNPKSPLHKEYRVTTSDASHVNFNFPLLNEFVEQIRESRKSVLIDDTRNDPRWQASADAPARSIVIAPMLGRFDLVGLLALVHEQVGYFKVEHQLLLQAIASQAAIAAENARLYTEMAREQQKSAAILQGAADAIMMFDADACLSMLNPAAQKLFTDFETRLGVPLARNSGYDTFIACLEDTFTSGASLAREVSWPDGRVFSARCTPLQEGGCVAVLNDVTHFKTLEKVKNEFIATASHDLRNPITSIKGFSHLLKQAGPLNDSQDEFVQRIQKAAQNMGELVENMLDLAKMDLGAEPAQEVLDLNELLWRIADEFQPQAEAKRQKITFEKTESSSMVRGDALYLSQALRNLIGNAIKYTPDGGVVMLSIEHESGMVNVTIRDTGYGISPADLPHVFDRFYRVRNNDQNVIEGNGLGLAIVKSTAEKHGGNVTVESELGKGSCFTLSLPLAEML